MQRVTGRQDSEDLDVRPGAWRRGWPVVLALLLLVTGSGLGGPAGLVQALRGSAQAGAGAADSRDQAQLRNGVRQAILSQRAADPHAAPASSTEPALAVASDARRLAVFRAVLAAAPRAAATTAGQMHAYEARGPPARA